jgi:GntR family transcriptional regulator, phosphonate transport system regulatory protein
MDAIETIARATDEPADGADGGRATTLWRRIAEDLTAEIAAGCFAPGDCLPTVVALAERFNVNRHTVRQALQAMRARGLVSVEQGRGTFVRAKPYDYRLGKRVRFRANFDPVTVDVAARLLSSGIEPLGPSDAERLGLPVGTPAWSIRSTRHVEGTPLSVGHHRLDAARFPDFDRAFAETMSITSALSRYGVTDYLRLSTRVTAVLPTEEECEVLGVAPTQPLLLARGIDGTAKNEPLHLVSTVFVGDRIELVVEPE